ncbi:MAG: hypothetical protein II576_10745 [Prevotella sp.]|nr:hypothetical protein [Prevotella sp.]
MSDSKYKDKYRIPSARAAWHDYDGGSYFITICTKYREHDFGEIEDGKMLLSEIGTHTQKCIEEITQHNPYAEIPLHVIMPNHLHLIVVIDYDKTPHDKRTVDVVTTPVETFPETSHNETMAKETFQETSLQRKTPIERATEMQSWLSVVLRQFKQSITRYAHENNIDFAWQTRFHDHIIRDNDEMNGITNYIENNVANWKQDKFYTPHRTL